VDVAGAACRIAVAEWERSAYFALRRRIFCDEQQLFTGDDRDGWDAAAIPIVCVAPASRLAPGSAPGVERVVGVVRIYEPSPGLWYGGRLGVDAAHRRGGVIGRSLVFTAVTTARARGCHRFLATVQPANVTFFERLHWRALGAVEAHGIPHQLMEADLSFYPPAAGAADARASIPTSQDA
jgi:putative N-acetyltransferase (TIGR04045 family)